MWLQFIGAATLVIVLVTPVLNISIATIALSLCRAEGQTLVTSLERSIQVVDDGYDERLSATTICACQSTRMDKLSIDIYSYPVEVNISQKRKRCDMTLANSNARNVNTNVSFDPTMKFFVG